MRNEKLLIRVNQEEKMSFEKLARAEGLATATWVRRELIRAAKPRSTKEPEVNHRHADSPTLLSLFCGPGGLDEGFKQAGFHTIVATDKDSECVNTFKANHPDSKAFVSDIRNLTLAQLDAAAGKKIEPVGVIGGPPCQSFSVSNVHQSEDDPRHALAESYAGLLAKLNRRKPISFFVFENVPGLLGARHKHRYERFKQLFRKAGFEINESLLNAKDYGVPQERERVIIVGINTKAHPGKVWRQPQPETRVKTVADVLKGLPEPVYNQRGLDPSTFPLHPNHWCLVPRSGKFTDGRLTPGVMFGRSFRTLEWDKPSWTVAYGHREVHVHPDGKRRLSMYEALLLQTFPKTYRLTGNLSAQIRLVSEAVPPRFAEHIAKSVRESLGL